MKILALLGAAFFCFANAYLKASAGTITYTFPFGSWLPTGTSGDGLTGGAVTRSGGMNSTTAFFNAFGTTSWPLSATIDTSKYFEFSVTPDPGYRYAIQSVNVDVARETLFLFTFGASAWALRSDIDAFAANLSATTLSGGSGEFVAMNTGSLGAAFESLATPTTFRIYGWNGAGSDMTGAIDNLSISFTAVAVPEPSEYAITAGLCLAGFAAWMRKRKTLRNQIQPERG